MRLKFFGHFNREDNSLEKVFMQGKIAGRRRRGRPHTRWRDNIKELIRKKLNQLNRDIRNRTRRMRLIHDTWYNLVDYNNNLCYKASLQRMR